MILPRRLLDQMVSHASREAPLEACGLLGGRGGRARSFYPSINRAKSPVFFTIEPSEILRTLRQMDRAGEELSAIFHSHPATEAYPSDADLLHHHYPGSAYLILSLRGGGPELRAYLIEGRRVREEPVEIEED